MTDTIKIEAITRTGTRASFDVAELLTINGRTLEELFESSASNGGGGVKNDEIFELQQALANLQGQIESLERRVDYLTFASSSPFMPQSQIGTPVVPAVASNVLTPDTVVLNSTTDTGPPKPIETSKIPSDYVTYHNTEA